MSYHIALVIEILHQSELEAYEENGLIRVKSDSIGEVTAALENEWELISAGLVVVEADPDRNDVVVGIVE